MPGRTFNSSDYRYGFNGMEKDDEVSGTGNSYTADFWQYDPRLGRRWNVDPVVKPFESGYSTFLGNPILFVDPNGDDPSTHTDKDGNVVQVIDDGDNSVYKHDDLSKWDKKSNLPTSEVGVSKMGETEYWDEFRAHSESGAILPEVAANAKIRFGESFDEDIKQLNSEAKSMSLSEIAENSTLNKKFDIKNDKSIAPDGPNTGKLLNGKYATARSAGNYLAGYNGATGNQAGFYISKDTYMRMAGALHQRKWDGGKTAMKIMFGGASYGSAPYFGETPHAGRRISEGFNRGVSERPPLRMSSDRKPKY